MPSNLYQSPGWLRNICASGTFFGWKWFAHISWGVTTLAPVAIAISAAEPTSSGCPSATRITSAFGKSGTFTGLSGLVTNGLLRMILPLGDVNRKMDHESHSIFTGPDWAGAWPAHAASIAAATPLITQRHLLAMVPPFRFDVLTRDSTRRPTPPTRQRPHGPECSASARPTAGRGPADH